MNFFGHAWLAARARPDAAFVFGAMLPDLDHIPLALRARHPEVGDPRPVTHCLLAVAPVAAMATATQSDRLHGAACVHAFPEPAGAAYSSVAAAAAVGTGTTRPTALTTAATITRLTFDSERVRISTPQSEVVRRTGA